ncbi:ABC transporter permease [Rhizobium calliandrae]|uniref:ABC transporter permease n=1 Tax=Rhizobium calliandrae TaxID=1312182 RepID=A0ABT7KGM8_9HYPH|nr:ABC transporter permease [Rhizobium calliandrae]MDL2407774.1 ABC transporter permease [Rhizobium calliandrae]
MGLLSAIALITLLAPAIVAQPQVQIADRLMPPSLSAPFGTDRMGSDLLSSVIWGARTTLFVAISTAAAGVLVGVPVGLISGYYRGGLSHSMMRVSDIALAIPQILVAIAIAQTYGPSLLTLIVALSITYWPFWARLVYAETRSIRNEVFIEAAVALGSSPGRIMVLHILPAVASSIAVRTSMGIGATIISAATLGFLGLGAPPQWPEWGRIMAESREYLPDAWWYPLAPGIAIFLTVLGFYMFADALGNVLEPRRRRARPK